jgi:hypothetical protein
LELLKAIKRLNQLKEEVDKLDAWVLDAKFNNKPIVGQIGSK